MLRQERGMNVRQIGATSCDRKVLSPSQKQKALVRAARKMKCSLPMFLISSEMSSMHKNKEKDKFMMITLSPSDSMFLEVTDP